MGLAKATTATVIPFSGIATRRGHFRQRHDMLGSVLKNEPEFGRLMKQPDEVGGAETQSAYGGRDFSCYDLEGHLWSFGTYDPW